MPAQKRSTAPQLPPAPLPLAHQADVAARAGLDTAPLLTEAALRTWLEATAKDHEEKRRFRRMPTSAVLSYLEPLDPALMELVRVEAWHSPGLLIMESHRSAEVGRTMPEVA